MNITLLIHLILVGIEALSLISKITIKIKIKTKKNTAQKLAKLQTKWKKIQNEMTKINEEKINKIKDKIYEKPPWNNKWEAKDE